MDNEIENALDGLSLVAVGVYLLLVYKNGNTERMLKELTSETGYIEFLISLAILKWAVDNDKYGIIWPLVFLGMLGAVLALAGRFDIASVTKQYAEGKSGLLDTFFAVLKGQAATKTSSERKSNGTIFRQIDI